MKWLYRLEEIICAIFILSATSLLFINIILRNFGMGTSWSEEFIRYSFIWITFIGAAICVRVGAHVSVDLIDSFVSNKIGKVILIIAFLITIIFMIWMLILGIKTVTFNYNNGQITPALSIPIYLVYLSIPIGFFLMIIHSLENLVKIIKKGDPAEVKGVEGENI